MIKVINIKKDKGPYDLYIGRPNYHLNLEGSKWANPFRMKNESERKDVLWEYEQYVRHKPELLAALPELKDLTLGCYCAPKRCHGDVLSSLYNEYVVTPIQIKSLPMICPVCGKYTVFSQLEDPTSEENNVVVACNGGCSYSEVFGNITNQSQLIGAYLKARKDES